MRVYYPLILTIIVAIGNLLTVSAIDDITTPLLNATSSITDAGQELLPQDENELSDGERNGEERLFEIFHRIAQKGSSWLEHVVPSTVFAAWSERQLYKKWVKDLPQLKPGVGTIEKHIAELKRFQRVHRKQDVSMIQFFHWLRFSRKHDSDYLQRLFLKRTEGIYSSELLEVWLNAGMKPKEVRKTVKDWPDGLSLSKSYDDLYTKIKENPKLTVDEALKLLDDTAKESA